MDLNRSAVDILVDLHDRSLSAETLLQATFERINALNPAVNAIVGLADREDVLAQARALDAGPVRGPLHGLPLAPKDLVNVAGLRSTQGSPIFADLVPDTDDVLAAKLRAAGAILIGKTNVPEFGLGSHTFNPVYGRTTNPYDPARTCGGSSGGAGVALALGMLALADGSDMMGSLRNPAAWNNVYGFRPTWGRVARELNEDGALHQMATRGPMARTPQDLALLLDVLTGPDPLRAEMAAPEPLLPGLQAFAVAGTDLSGMRIGWLGDWGGAFPCEPGILEVSADALDVLRGLGAVVDDLLPPHDFDDLWRSWTALRSWQVGAGLRSLRRHADLMKDSAQWEMERVEQMSAIDVHEASAARARWAWSAHALFERYDALVLPTTQVWPFPIELAWPTAINGVEMDTYHRWMAAMVPVSLLGLPALSVPAGFGEAGLPAGVQIFGPRGSDARLLAIGEAYHRPTQWPQRRPPAMALD